MATRYMILDNKGVIWSSADHDALETGSALMAAVASGDTEAYAEELGDSSIWHGDLIFAQEISRTR